MGSSTNRNDQTGQSGPPSKLVPNIPVGPNRNGPFHFMYQQKFPEFWELNGKCPKIFNQLISFLENNTLLLVFSVTPFKIDQNKNQNYSTDKSRIWEMKGGKYTKTLAKSWVEEIIRIRDIRGNV